jgi:hypothetical protein
MHIDINDPALEARMQKQIRASGSVEEALKRLLQTQEEQDRWLFESRETIVAKIGRGLAQLDRGEGMPGDEARAQLQERKAAWLKDDPATTR